MASTSLSHGKSLRDLLAEVQLPLGPAKAKLAPLGSAASTSSQSLCPSVPAGRADYYGNLPNLAARVSALAQPGQVLLEGCQGFGDELQWIKEDSLALLQLGRGGTPGASSVGECIEISYLGQFLLKVGTVHLCCIPAPAQGVQTPYVGPISSLLEVGLVHILCTSAQEA